MDAPHSKKQNSKSLWSLSQDQPQAFTLLPLLAINIVRLTLLLGPTECPFKNGDLSRPKKCY